MLRAPLPANERERLQALHALELLDTEAEHAFDAATALAASVFDVPIVLVTLLDAERQWFKSQYGLDRPYPNEREYAFCAHAILQTDVFEIPDAQSDARFADNPLVTGDPGIRFYAGMPLIDANGLAFGTICLIDRRPRQLTAAQRAQLREFARVLVGAIAARVRPSEIRAGRRAAIRDTHVRRRKKLLNRLTKGLVIVRSLRVADGVTDAPPA